MTANKSPKTTINLALKLAILKRGTQRKVSIATDIGEVRLSEIVRGRGVPATRDERRALADHLRVPQRELFPPPELSA